MGSSQTKEEVIIAQTGAGNSASGNAASTTLKDLTVFELIGILTAFVVVLLIIYVTVKCGCLKGSKNLRRMIRREAALEYASREDLTQVTAEK